jgi:hypothetical protein
MGGNTLASLGPEIALGSFSGTWDKATQYNNNQGNPNGAVALSQVRTDVSFFQKWMRFANNGLGT